MLRCESSQLIVLHSNGLYVVGLAHMCTQGLVASLCVTTGTRRRHQQIELHCVYPSLPKANGANCVCQLYASLSASPVYHVD